MTLFDPIRSLYVEATPEERVRQRWIANMVGPLGFPKGLISVEKAIGSSVYPDRRIDILCSTPGKEGLVPLLLVECKAVRSKGAALRQLMGYNDVIKAPFLCVIEGLVATTFWFEEKKLAQCPFLPTYAQLTTQAHLLSRL